MKIAGTLPKPVPKQKKVDHLEGLTGKQRKN
jgi:hypothetical protein